MRNYSAKGLNLLALRVARLTLALFSATVLQWLLLPSAYAATAVAGNFSAVEMQQVVNTYCLACHNDRLSSSGLSLQQVDFNNPGKHAEVLEMVVKKLQAHMMPPAGMPRPEFETYEVMTTWLETELDQVWAANPNPGRISPIQRMSRYEYNNAVNELLGLDVDVTSLLPGDPTFHKAHL